jgi:hypothetical protein
MSDDQPEDKRGPVLSWLLGATGAAGLITFAMTVLPRIGSPYPLEWMEGTSLQHALMLARGELPYAAPRADFIAYVYPPLAYVPVALATLLLGPSLPVARAVSLLCMVGTLTLLGIASARLARSRAAGLFSAGLFAFGFGYGGAFLDLARVDALFVLCCAAAVERLSAGRNPAALGWLAASALAKQHGAVLLLAVSVVMIGRGRTEKPKELYFGFSVRPLLALIVACSALQLATDGWFGRYTLEVPGQHGLVPKLLVSFPLVDLLVYLPVLTISTVLALGRRIRALTELDALTLAAIVVSALGRAHPGGDDNVRLPAFAVLCVVGVAPLAAGALNRRYLSAALLLQAAILFQPPSAHAPPASSAARFEALSAALARCAAGGPAVALDYGLFTRTPFLHTMALSDLRLGGDSELSRAGTRALLDALRGPSAPHAIAVGDSFPELDAALEARYEPCADLPAPRLATGYQPGQRTEQGLRQRVFKLKSYSAR